jgi:3-carboxy-cis,cis-muconate cycloisomerase
VSLFDPIFGASAVVAATDDRAWLSALCEVEAALARACARVGVVEPEAAARITAAADGLSRSDPAELGRAAAADGNPVIPLVAALRAAVGEGAAAVHLGATSQDVLDTATMLIAHRALAGIVADLSACGSSCARLARDHRDTAMAGRTLLQQAVPTTFGALAAVWGAGLDRARAGLAAARGELPVQLGGAAGTLAGLPVEIVAAFADEVGLAEPAGVWHTDRTVVAQLAGALGVAAGAIGKVATDVVLLAQTEIGEVREQAPGGSSIMAHKQNPIAAVTARAGAAQAPGLVATLLSGTHELQRAAGAWHAEWPALIGLLRAVGGSASRLDTCLAGLHVDRTAMTRNLDGLDGDAGHAGDLVDRYLDGRNP